MIKIKPWIEMIKLTHSSEFSGNLEEYSKNMEETEPVQKVVCPIEIFQKFSSTHDFDEGL